MVGLYWDVSLSKNHLFFKLLFLSYVYTVLLKYFLYFIHSLSSLSGNQKINEMKWNCFLMERAGRERVGWSILFYLWVMGQRPLYRGRQSNQFHYPFNWIVFLPCFLLYEWERRRAAHSNKPIVFIKELMKR